MIRVGGFSTLSLSDFPGRVAALVFTRGCNFRCPFCHNGHLLSEHAGADDGAWDFPSVLDRLSRRRRQLDGVVFTGGEPTIQAALFEAMGAVRRLGLEIQLDTNGSRPGVVSELLRHGLVQRVAMDVKAPWERYAELAGVPVDIEPLQQTVRLLAASGREHEFRTTWVKPMLSSGDLERIRAQLPAGSPHRVQAFVPGLSLSDRLRTPDAPLRSPVALTA